MNRILVRGGRILDPSSKRDELGDVLVEDGKIAAVGEGLDVRGSEVLEAEGGWIVPGFFDMHAHLRSTRRTSLRAVAQPLRAASRRWRAWRTPTRSTTTRR